jgi:hypothetical protein
MSDKLSQLRKLHDELQSGRFQGNRYELLHLFGNAGFIEARPTMESFLDDPDPQLRYIALNVLVLHWGIPEYHETSLRMARADPDADVRRLAASCVGTLYKATRSPDALRLLLDVISNEDENGYVRDAAYSAILDILGVPRADLPSADRLIWPADIDWSRVRAAQAIVDESYSS